MRPTQMRYGDVMTAWYYYTKLHCGNALLREPAGSSRVSHLSNVIRNELNTIIYDTKITVDIEQIKRSNAILNLVENIQKHESVRKLSQHPALEQIFWLHQSVPNKKAGNVRLVSQKSWQIGSSFSDNWSVLKGECTCMCAGNHSIEWH
eukprot:742078_1